MAEINELRVGQYLAPVQPNGGVTTFFFQFTPGDLPSFPAAADTVGLLQLPPGCQVIDGAVRTTASAAAATGTLQLAFKADGGSEFALTDALAADAAGSERMNTGPTERHDVTADIYLKVGTAALNGAGTIIGFVQYVRTGD